MSWHYLQGQEAASWAGDCLDGASDALLSLMPTPGESCLPDRPMEACHDSQSGTMSAPSTDDRGEVTSTSSAADSHAKTSAPLGEALDSQESDLAFGGKCTESFAKWDPSSSSWRTSQHLLTEGWTLFSARWPTSGLMLNGACFQRDPLERLTSAKGCGLLPTPTASGGGSNKSPGPNAVRRPSLQTMARHNLWLTPTASSYKTGGNRPHLRGVAGGPLNPTWVEWLMGWPLGWTALEPLEMGRFQKWLEQHGICSSNDSEPLDTTQRRGR
jgi:hypothetical protein